MTPEEIDALADRLRAWDMAEGIAEAVADLKINPLWREAEATLRAYAALLREREGEERLLDSASASLMKIEGKYYWCDMPCEHVHHTDRATATRLALEAIK